MNYTTYKRCVIFMLSMTLLALLSALHAQVAQAFTSESLYYFEKQVQEADRSLIDTQALTPDLHECLKHKKNCPDYDSYIVQVTEYWFHEHGRDGAFLVLIVSTENQVFVETDKTVYFEEDGDFLVSLENGVIYDLREAMDMGSGNFKIAQAGPTGSSGNVPSSYADDVDAGNLGDCSTISTLRGCSFYDDESSDPEFEINEPDVNEDDQEKYYPYGDAPGVDFHYHMQTRGGGSGSGGINIGPDTFLDAITEIEEAIRGGVN